MTHDYRIHFGTVGWQHSQWLGAFYPEDLPEDWWLPFYGNEFPIVAVPASSWSADPEEQIDEWLDNSDEHFGFIFEWSWTTSDDLRKFCQLLEPIKEKTKGLLLQVPWSVCSQKNVLAVVLNEISGHFAICIELMADDGITPETSIDFNNTHFNTLLSKTQVSCCWHGTEADQEKFFSGKLALTKIIDTSAGPKHLRQVLEICSAQVQSHETTVILFTGEPPPLQKVRDAMVMLELLA